MPRDSFSYQYYGQWRPWIFLNQSIGKENDALPRPYVTQYNEKQKLDMISITSDVQENIDTNSSTNLDTSEEIYVGKVYKNKYYLKIMLSTKTKI